MKKWMYLKLQCKRALKIYPTILLITILTLLSILLIVGAVVYSYVHRADQQKVTIAIVGNAEDSFMGMGINTLQNMGGLGVYATFPEMEEAQAIAALKKGEISGYLQIPDNYIDGLVSGRNVPARYVTLKTPSGLGDAMSEEALLIASDLLVETQNGVYSMQRIAEAYDAEDDIDTDIEGLNIQYMEYALSRSSVYDVRAVGVYDYLTYGGYYICGLLVFFMLLWGIACNKLLNDKNLSISRMLRRSGMCVGAQVLCEYAGFLMISFLTVLGMCVLAGIVIGFESFGIRELERAGFLSACGFAFRIFPVIVMFSMLHLFLYEVFTGPVSSVLMQFLIAVGLGYISGCFYPNTFFPQSVQTLAAVLPAGAGFSFMRKCMADVPLGIDALLVWGYTLLFGITTVLCRRFKITGDGQ